jgi:hypothetical protein
MTCPEGSPGPPLCEWLGRGGDLPCRSSRVRLGPWSRLDTLRGRRHVQSGGHVSYLEVPRGPSLFASSLARPDLEVRKLAVDRVLLVVRARGRAMPRVVEADVGSGIG